MAERHTISEAKELAYRNRDRIKTVGDSLVDSELKADIKYEAEKDPTYNISLPYIEITFETPLENENK